MTTKVWDNTNQGALHKQEKKTDKHPDYKGNLNVTIPWSLVSLWFKTNEGKDLPIDHTIAAWLKTSKAGKKYMSLEVTRKEERIEARATPAVYDDATIDDEIPF